MNGLRTHSTLAAFLLACLLTLGLNGCHTDCPTDPPVDDEFESIGVITGPDLRACACCGGYLITIDGTQYRIWEFPADHELVLDSMENFPMTVRLDWEPAPQPCIGDEIIVERIEEVK